ncbi:MAG: hypothetical protein AAGU74_08270 [Bacillota bacterium]
MKKALVLLFALLLTLSACAVPASSGVSQEEYDAVVAELEALKASASALPLPSEPPVKPTAAPTPTPEPIVAQVRVFVHEDDYIKIEYVGCESTDRGKEEIVFYIENKTNNELTFQADAFAMDGESLGHTSGSDGIAANSRGKIRYSTKEAFPTLTPTSLTGTIKVIDFEKTIWGKQSYDVKFVDLQVG